MVRWTILAFTILLAACASSPDPRLMPVTARDPEALRRYREGVRKADRFHHEEALKDFRAAVDRDPDFALAWLRMSWVAGNQEASNEHLERAAALMYKVTEAERLHIRATRAERAGRVEEALDLRRRILERYPRDPRAHYRLGMTFWMTDSAAGIPHMEKAVRLDPDLDVAWNMLGYLYAEQGRLEEAARAHRRYVKLLPNEPNAHDSYAETLLKAGRFEQSIAQYERALEFDPSFTWSRLGIGHNLVFLGRYDEAKAAYARALEKADSPQDRYQAASWLVTWAVYANREAAALEAADRAHALAKELGTVEAANALRNRARVLHFTGDSEAAVDQADAALAALPADAPEPARRDLAHSVLRLKVEVAADAGDLETARGRLEALRNLTSERGAVWHDQLLQFAEGYVRLKEGDAPAAVAFFEKSARTDPRVVFFLAEALRAAGRSGEASDLYREVVHWNAPGLGHALVLDRAKERLE